MKEILLLAREMGLPNNDIRDIDEYINHNEWGLAFEVLCSSIQEYDLKASDDLYQKLCELGEKMEMGNDLWQNILLNKKGSDLICLITMRQPSYIKRI